jgi:hypothetical protein
LGRSTEGLSAVAHARRHARGDLGREPVELRAERLALGVKRRALAWDEADARDQLLRLLGDGARWAIWAEPNIRRMHAPRGTDNTRLREFKAIVWAGSPETPGQRLSVWARGREEARRLIEDQHGPEIMAFLTDEEDVERTRRR